MIPEKETIIQLLSVLFPNVKIYLFGSRARGDYKSTSDIDFALDHEEKKINFLEIVKAKNVYDLTWKYLKHFLEKYHGIIANSPKSVFRDSQVQNIITEEELRLLLKMVDDRNLTRHTYNEQILFKISS